MLVKIKDGIEPGFPESYKFEENDIFQVSELVLFEGDLTNPDKIDVGTLYQVKSIIRNDRVLNLDTSNFLIERDSCEVIPDTE